MYIVITVNNNLRVIDLRYGFSSVFDQGKFGKFIEMLTASGQICNRCAYVENVFFHCWVTSLPPYILKSIEHFFYVTDDY